MPVALLYGSSVYAPRNWPGATRGYGRTALRLVHDDSNDLPVREPPFSIRELEPDDLLFLDWDNSLSYASEIIHLLKLEH